MNNKPMAIIYSEAETIGFKLVPFELSKEDFENSTQQCVTNYEYSHLLRKWIASKVLLVGIIKVFRLVFDDGSYFESGLSVPYGNYYDDGIYAKKVQRELVVGSSKKENQN